MRSLAYIANRKFCEIDISAPTAAPIWDTVPEHKLRDWLRDWFFDNDWFLGFVARCRSMLLK